MTPLASLLPPPPPPPHPLLQEMLKTSAMILNVQKAAMRLK